MGFISRYTAFAFVVAVIAFLALARFTDGRRVDPVPAPVAAPVVVPVAIPVAIPVALRVAAPVKKKSAVRGKVAAAPVLPAKTRGEALRDPGEAFGGRPPQRVDKSTSAAR